MRALQVHELTGPDGVGVAEVAEPAAGDGQVVVDVHAGGVSFVDFLLSRGGYQIKLDPPFTLGLQLAGTDPDGRRVAAVGLGAFAERVAVPEFAVLPLPDDLSFAEGAAFVMNYQTAHFGLKRRGRLRTGETVLVQGAGGGAGTAAVQVAHALGARVIAAASDERKRQAARRAGADEAIDTAEGWRERVLELTDGRGVDIVGVNWGGLAMVQPEIVRDAAEDLERFHTKGLVRPVIGERYPLERGADALRAIEARKAVGNLVLELR